MSPAGPPSAAPRSSTMALLPRTWNEELQEALQRIARQQGRRRRGDAICILMTLVLQALPGWTEEHVASVVRRQPPTTASRLELLQIPLWGDAPFAICRLPRGFNARGAEAHLERISKEMHRVLLGRARRRLPADAWRGVYVPVGVLADAIRYTAYEVELVAKTSYSNRRRTARFRLCADGALVTSVKLVTRGCQEAVAPQAARDAGVCCVCLTAAATHALSPCGHYCLCAACAPCWLRGGSCPLCRGGVREVLRIFRSAQEDVLSPA